MKRAILLKLARDIIRFSGKNGREFNVVFPRPLARTSRSNHLQVTCLQHKIIWSGPACGSCGRSGWSDGLAGGQGVHEAGVGVAASGADLADRSRRDLLSFANHLLCCASIARHDGQIANQMRWQNC
jgi:hypothetical protein